MFDKSMNGIHLLIQYGFQNLMSYKYKLCDSLTFGRWFQIETVVLFLKFDSYDLIAHSEILFIITKIHIFILR